jgi:hypothetical protein
MYYEKRSTELETLPMLQQTLAEVTFEHYRKPTRREQFLSEMNRVVPWTELVAMIEPVYPKAEGPGRPPVGVERMLRLPCLQQWFNLSDPAVEEVLYDSRAMRQFVGIDRGVPWRLPGYCVSCSPLRDTPPSFHYRWKIVGSGPQMVATCSQLLMADYVLVPLSTVRA